MHQHFQKSKSRTGSFVDSLETRMLFDGTVLTQFTNFALGTVSPASSIAIDSTGNLFGTYTYTDATHNGGVWELKKLSAGYDPVAVSIAAFPADGSMGKNSRVGVIIDSKGNLFGANDPYDSSSTGVLWELPKTTSGFGTLQKAATFTHPQQGMSGLLSIDSNDVILGLAEQPGGDGLDTSTIFRYSAANGFQSVLDFNTSVTGGAESNLVTDPLGNIFGSTINGGTQLAGAIFELPVGGSAVQVVASFDRVDAGPFGNISVITNGNNIVMFGGTEGDELGGTNSGTLWELPVTNGSPGVLTNFVTFGGATKPKVNPTTTFIGPDGNLYGTASGESGADGVVWEAIRSGDTFGEPSTIATLSTAQTSAFPSTSLVTDGSNIFGATVETGIGNAGYIYGFGPATIPTTTGGGSTNSTATLSATFESSTLPTTIISGGKIKGVISGHLTNTSNTIQKGFAYAAIYETDGVVQPQLTASQKLKINLKPGKSIAYHVKINGTVTLDPGQYTLYPYAIDTAQNYNPTSSGASLKVQAKTIVLSAGSSSTVKPSTVKVGKSGVFTVDINNTGNTDATGSANIVAGLSSDGQTSSVTFAPVTKVYKIKAGKKITLHVKLPIGNAVTPGTYFSEVKFTEADQIVDAFGTTPFTVVG